jgi:putative polyketide hydroxylase
MRHQEPTTVDVLVVGAGPAGLTAAATLGRLGVDTVVAERRPVLSSLPRATGVSTRSMEIFRSFGLEAEIRAGGADVDMRMLSVETHELRGRGHRRPDRSAEP